MVPVGVSFDARNGRLRKTTEKHGSPKSRARERDGEIRTILVRSHDKQQFLYSLVLPVSMA